MRMGGGGIFMWKLGRMFFSDLNDTTIALSLLHYCKKIFQPFNLSGFRSFFPLPMEDFYAQTR